VKSIHCCSKQIYNNVCIQSFSITLIIELLLRMSHQHTFLLIYLHVNELVAIRLPAGILMGIFVAVSFGQELLHFPVVLY